MDNCSCTVHQYIFKSLGDLDVYKRQANPSLIEDLKIIFATLKILFERDSAEGIAEGSTTAMTASAGAKKASAGDKASA